MDLFNIILYIPNIIIAIANIILILFVSIQIRDTRKPILTTKILSEDKDITDKAEVLENGILYIVLNNISKNIAKNIKIKYIFKFQKLEIIIDEKKLSHLNSKEATRFVLKTKKIMKDYPELFEEITKGDMTKKMPKETLKINLIIKISFNPIFGSLVKYNIEDNYEIVWGSKINYPRFEDHSIFMCWNKRSNDYYIYKTDNITQDIRIKPDISMLDENNW